MISRKYLSDYRVEKVTDEKGRIRSEAIYIGGDYTFPHPIPRSDKVLILCLSIVSWFAFIGALIPVISLARRIHIMLPFIFSGLPLYLMTGTAISLLGVKEIMTRERAEVISKRLPPGALFSAVLSGGAAIALLVTAIIAWDDAVFNDFIFAVLAVVICAASAVAFAKCRKLKAMKV